MEAPFASSDPTVPVLTPETRQREALWQGFKPLDPKGVACLLRDRRKASFASGPNYAFLNLITGEQVSGAEVRERSDDCYAFVGLGQYDPRFGAVGPWICLTSPEENLLPGVCPPGPEWMFKKESPVTVDFNVHAELSLERSELPAPFAGDFYDVSLLSIEKV